MCSLTRHISIFRGLWSILIVLSNPSPPLPFRFFYIIWLSHLSARRLSDGPRNIASAHTFTTTPTPPPTCGNPIYYALHRVTFMNKQRHYSKYPHHAIHGHRNPCILCNLCFFSQRIVFAIVRIISSIVSYSVT